MEINELPTRESFGVNNIVKHITNAVNTRIQEKKHSTTGQKSHQYCCLNRISIQI